MNKKILHENLKLIPTRVKKATPMMAQYLKIKSKYQDYLLLYRMGDFYELFFEDAVIASQALSITLTKRGKHEDESIPMCGVPAHSCEPYLHKLIEQGYSVALCEQVEDPSLAKARGAKSVVKREVTRLITPGTLTEENLLNPNTANYLTAIASYTNNKITSYGIAYIDLSTGLFRAMPTDEIRMLTDITQLNPREILISQDSDKLILNKLELLKNLIKYEAATNFNLYESSHRIKTYYNIIDEQPLAHFSNAEICAISAIIAYVEKTQLANQPKLTMPTAVITENLLFIDASTRQNLELFKTLSGERKGSLLHNIDYTLTHGGSRLLYDRLMHPLKNVNLINERLASVNFFISSTEITNKIRELIKGCSDGERALSRLESSRGTPRDLGAIQSILELSEKLIKVIRNAMLPAELAQEFKRLSLIPNNLRNQLDTALTIELPLKKEDGNFIASNYDKELDLLRNIQNESQAIIEGLQAKYVNKTQIKNLKIKHNNILGYFIEITPSQYKQIETLQASGTIDFIQKQKLTNAVRFTTSELKQTEYNITNSTAKALEIELRIFEELRNLIVKNAENIRNIANAISVLDVSSSLAQLATERNYCYPKIDDSLSFYIKKGRHPVVEESLKTKSESFIANDCNLSPLVGDEQGQFWLLTGPNMGGKSTFLRQNALFAIMAQIGSFIPAEKAHIGVVDFVFSRVGASDNLAKGHSTFMVEMVETATILNQATNKSLVILDEIGRGTATYDGLAIAQSTAEYLHNENKCRAIFATHFHELTNLTEQLENLNNYTIKVLENHQTLVFLHEIIPGKADKSYGIQVAKLSGLPQKMILRAQAILKNLESDKFSENYEKMATAKPQPTQDEQLTSALNEIRERLNKIDANNLTPMQALEEVYHLSNIIKAS